MWIIAVVRCFVVVLLDLENNNDTNVCQDNCIMRIAGVKRVGWPNVGDLREERCREKCVMGQLVKSRCSGRGKWKNGWRPHVCTSVKERRDEESKTVLELVWLHREGRQESGVYYAMLEHWPLYRVKSRVTSRQIRIVHYLHINTHAITLETLLCTWH